MKIDRLLPRSVNSDKIPEALENGEVPYMSDMRIISNENGQLGFCTASWGMRNTNMLVGGSYCIGMFEDVQHNTAIGFFWYDSETQYIARYYPDLNEWQMILRGSLEFLQTDVITAVSLTNNWLGWSDTRNTGRLINLDKGNRSNKAVEFSIIFGKPEPGVNDIFVNGTEYRFTAYDNSGVPFLTVNNLLIWTVPSTAYENKLYEGANEFVNQFNASAAAAFFTASVASDGGVTVTENSPSGLANGTITTVAFTTSGTAPVALVYNNIYAPNFVLESMWRLSCPPNWQPTAGYATDTTTPSTTCSNRCSSSKRSLSMTEVARPRGVLYPIYR